MRAAGCRELVVILGYKAQTVDSGDAIRVINPDYMRNNILHSLLYARDHLNGPVMVSYSDIWVEPWIHRQLATTPGDIVIAADRDWQGYYEGRTDHPTEEAENVFFDLEGRAVQMGKHLRASESATLTCGEFLGLWRMSAAGTARLREAFEEVDARLAPEAPFQQAKEWRKAYITDMMQELINQGDRIDCTVIERAWAEIDTVQDYQRLPAIAEDRRLWTLCGTESERRFQETRVP